MRTQKHEEEIEKTFEMLNHPTKIKAGNDFYFNLRKRMDETDQEITHVVSSLKWQLAVVSAVLVVNIFIAGSFLFKPETKADYTSEWISEYNLNVTTLYDSTGN